ncbi:hypothetical protein ABE073_04110 [Lederbergia citrisecunda]|uniref:hypothetical protein n=1 Tax=Lederbergia citrisecunda TaxID=2833583 RepID=UPI003D267583
MGKTIITAVLNKQSGIMDVLRTNLDSNLIEQVERQLKEVRTVTRVVIETEFKHYIIKEGVSEE